MKAARKLIRQITWYQQKEVSSIYHAPGIIDGYRKPGRPWTYYAKSIFQVHNETANIWSHLLGAFYCIYRTYHCCYELDFIGDAMTWPIMAFLVSATTCGICSAFAHLMHSKCDDAHYFCFLVDFLGISTFCHGSGQMSYLLGVSLPLSQAVGRWFLIFNAVICTCVMASLSAELVWCENLLMRKVLKVVPNLCAIVLRVVYATIITDLSLLRGYIMRGGIPFYPLFSCWVSRLGLFRIPNSFARSHNAWRFQCHS